MSYYNNVEHQARGEEKQVSILYIMGLIRVGFKLPTFHMGNLRSADSVTMSGVYVDVAGVKDLIDFSDVRNLLYICIYIYIYIHIYNVNRYIYIYIYI